MGELKSRHASAWGRRRRSLKAPFLGLEPRLASHPRPKPRGRRPLHGARMDVARESSGAVVSPREGRGRGAERESADGSRPPIPALSCPASVPSGRPKLIDASANGCLIQRPGRSDGRTLERRRGDWRVDLEAGSAKHSIRSKVAGKRHCMSTAPTLSERDLAHPYCEVASESRAAPSRSHSSSFDQHRRPDALRTAIAIAFFWPTRTTSLLPRVTPV
jgi:hypothetical protein